MTGIKRRQSREMLSGAEMVVRSLIDQGAKQVFGYPAAQCLDIYDALHTAGGIDHVLVRHELRTRRIWRCSRREPLATLAWCW